MNPNAEVISRLYSSFEKRDAAGMAGCYHADAFFEDPVFGRMPGWRAKAMWRMFCDGDSDLRLEVSGVSADASAGAAHWDATYTFPATRRKVINRIDAAFRFKDGLIVDHLDSFDLWKWASMALGLRGTFLGWLPPVQNAIRTQANRRLDSFIKEKGITST